MMGEVTAEQLDKWEKLAKAAHRGPWFVRHGTNPDYPHGVEVGYPQQVLSEGDVHLIGEFYDGTDVAPAIHAPFVAEARTAVPALVAEVRRLQWLDQLYKTAEWRVCPTCKRKGSTWSWRRWRRVICLVCLGEGMIEIVHPPDKSGQVL